MYIEVGRRIPSSDTRQGRLLQLAECCWSCRITRRGDRQQIEKQRAEKRPTGTGFSSSKQKISGQLHSKVKAVEKVKVAYPGMRKGISINLINLVRGM